MSQRRRIRRTVTPTGPTRRERTIAYLGASAVVGFTGFTVWALRPGGTSRGAGQALNGGIANRQPKATWLVLLTVLAMIAAIAFLRSRVDSGRDGGAGQRARRRVVLVGTMTGIVIAAVIGGSLWPGGLLFHSVDDGIPDLPIPTAPQPTDSPSTTPDSSTPDSSTPDSSTPNSTDPTLPASSTSSTSG